MKIRRLTSRSGALILTGKVPCLPAACAVRKSPAPAGARETAPMGGAELDTIREGKP